MSPPKKAQPLPEPIADVPQGEVGDTVQSFIDNDGVTELQVKRQSDGNFTITPRKVTS